MSSKLSSRTRAIVAASSVAMLAVLVLPIWRIELSAPQYPEGLVLRIFSYRIGGDVEVVNGLNHYIGMHTLHSRDFVEFVLLPYIIGGFAALGFLVAFINRKVPFILWIALFGIIALTSMIDFYRWEYNYGHNLDPNAPIQVPGMAYQPPLIGYKQLLNFGAYSIPDTGGWLFVLVGIVLATQTILEFRPKNRPRQIHTAAVIIIPFIVIACSSCQRTPSPIRPGEDHCDFCTMTFGNNHFGAAIATKKGRIFKFDDIHCLQESLRSGRHAKTDIAAIWLADFETGGWLKAEGASLLESESFRTPMGGNIAAFADAVHRQQYLEQNKGRLILWKDIYR